MLKISHRYPNRQLLAVIAILLPVASAGSAAADENMAPAVLRADAFQHYVDTFNADDEELYANAFPNARAWAFLESNIPLFECPDKDIERTYYFRWWTYRKHVRDTPDGWVITEFLPTVPWSGKHNTISCPAGVPRAPMSAVTDGQKRAIDEALAVLKASHRPNWTAAADRTRRRRVEGAH